MKMPDIGLYDHDYRGMTAEDIYDWLLKHESQTLKQGMLASNGTGDDGFPRSGNETGIDEEVTSRSAGGFDHHLKPDDIRGESLRAKEFPTSEERKRLRISLTRELESKLHGTAAGLMASEIRKATKVEVPWHILLSRFFTGIRRDDYRMMPPNKKHIQCDAEIQDVQQYDECTEVSFDRYRLLGRGGTSFIPVFEWISENVFKKFTCIDALIYLTDGFGSFPDRPPHFPVLWVMTEHSQPAVPFGEVIRMQLQTVVA